VTDAIDRGKTAERLLTREQINEITDLEWLEGELDHVTSDAKSIEVDLEFRSDDFATEEWEHRARRALTAHHICAGHLTRRIAFLKRGERKGPTPPDHDAKARKKEAEAARLVAAAENKRAKAQQEREVTIRAMVAFADRQSLLSHFRRVAREQLDAETFARLSAMARASLDAALLAQLPAIADQSPEGRDPQGLDAKHASGGAGTAIAQPSSAQSPDISGASHAQ
jgi:hypothetical protein